MEHDNAVEYYAEGMVKMRICFPHGKADCRHCRFIRFLEPLGIYRCALTDELVERCELDQRNEMCPVELPYERMDDLSESRF